MRPGASKRLRFLFGQEPYENCNRHELIEELLNQGGLVSIDQKRARARILPFSRQL
jgi:hypothetical protein